MTSNTPAVHASAAEYLASLTWDDTPRLDRWLIDYAGACDTPSVREVSRWGLIAAVRRARHPGCRLDQMLLIEGPQGCGKSEALRILAIRDDWFTTDLPLQGGERLLVEATTGKWFVAASELRGLRRQEAEALKACLSRTHDEARMPYDHKITQVPRQFVIVGTVNDTEGYLQDPAGNRRFWPVRVERFDLEKLRTDRDQLWAEAARAEALGETIHLNSHTRTKKDSPAQEI